jgi:hypothetical protein
MTLLMIFTPGGLMAAAANADSPLLQSRHEDRLLAPRQFDPEREVKYAPV